MTNSTYRFILRTGPNPGTVYDLTKDVSFIGRDVGNDIVIGDAEISRQHARISKSPEGYVIEDLGSTNGTYIAGTRIAGPRLLKPGDLVSLGESITLTFDAADPSAAATVAKPVEPMPAPTQKEAPKPAAAPAPAYREPAAPADLGPSKKRRGWVYAGVGCVVIIIICAVVGWFMDAYYPNILYAPLRLFGFY